MKIIDIKKKIQEEFLPLVPKGYSFKKSKCELVKESDGFNQVFTIFCHNKGGWVQVHSEVRFQVPLVMKVYNQIFDCDFAVSEVLFGFETKIEGSKRYYAIQTEEELDGLAEMLKVDFDHFVEPLFDKCHNIKSLAKHMIKGAQKDGWSFTGSTTFSLSVLMILAWSQQLGYDIFIDIAKGCYIENEKKMEEIEKVESFLKNIDLNFLDRL